MKTMFSYYCARKFIAAMLPLAAVAWSATACGSAPIEGPREGIDHRDPKFGYEGHRLLYDGKPFNGNVRTDAGNTLLFEPYVDGYKHGLSMRWWKTGGPAVRRTYDRGMPVGKHYAWWPDGQKRFLYHYDSQGRLHGDFIQWGRTGRVSGYAVYHEGEELGYKQWGAGGDVYRNYVFSEDRSRRIGVPPPKLCKPIQGNETQTTNYQGVYPQ